jgi:hypothetical protein
MFGRAGRRRGQACCERTKDEMARRPGHQGAEGMTFARAHTRLGGWKSWEGTDVRRSL